MSVIGPVERPEPLTIGDERAVLLSMLDYYRATLLKKCEGLDRAQLELQSVEPSDLTLLDLLRHLAGAEQFWFQVCFLGEQLPPLYLRTPEGDIDPTDLTPMEGVVEKFQRACGKSRRAVVGHSFDEVAHSAVMDADVSLRYICVHMLEEYARHCGHADLLRERIDGTVGD